MKANNHDQPNPQPQFLQPETSPPPAQKNPDSLGYSLDTLLANSTNLRGFNLLSIGRTKLSKFQISSNQPTLDF